MQGVPRQPARGPGTRSARAGLDRARFPRLLTVPPRRARARCIAEHLVGEVGHDAARNLLHHGVRATSLSPGPTAAGPSPRSSARMAEKALASEAGLGGGGAATISVAGSSAAAPGSHPRPSAPARVSPDPGGAARSRRDAYVSRPGGQRHGRFGRRCSRAGPAGRTRRSHPALAAEHALDEGDHLLGLEGSTSTASA